MKITSILILALGSMGNVLVASSSHAYDLKEYPGSMCQSYFGSGATKITKYDGSKTYNRAGGPMWITCPVVKDNGNGTNGIHRASIEVRRGQNAVDPFFCEFRNISQFGNVAYTGHSNSFRGRGWWSFTFDIDSNLNGSYVILCRVPRDSEITSYKVYEYDSNL